MVVFGGWERWDTGNLPHMWDIQVKIKVGNSFRGVDCRCRFESPQNMVGTAAVWHMRRKAD